MSLSSNSKAGSRQEAKVPQDAKVHPKNTSNGVSAIADSLVEYSRKLFVIAGKNVLANSLDETGVRDLRAYDRSLRQLIISDILKQTSLQDRIQTTEKWIAVAQGCLANHDHYTYEIILDAIKNDPALKKLITTNNNLSPNSKELLANFSLSTETQLEESAASDKPHIPNLNPLIGQIERSNQQILFLRSQNKEIKDIENEVNAKKDQLSALVSLHEPLLPEALTISASKKASVVEQIQQIQQAEEDDIDNRTGKGDSRLRALDSRYVSLTRQNIILAKNVEVRDQTENLQQIKAAKSKFKNIVFGIVVCLGCAAAIAFGGPFGAAAGITGLLCYFSSKVGGAKQTHAKARAKEAQKLKSKDLESAEDLGGEFVSHVSPTQQQNLQSTASPSASILEVKSESHTRMSIALGVERTASNNAVAQVSEESEDVTPNTAVKTRNNAVVVAGERFSGSSAPIKISGSSNGSSRVIQNSVQQTADSPDLEHSSSGLGLGLSHT